MFSGLHIVQPESCKLNNPILTANSLYKSGFTHRPLSSSFSWLVFRILQGIIPKRNYLGAYGFMVLHRDRPSSPPSCKTLQASHTEASR